MTVTRKKDLNESVCHHDHMFNLIGAFLYFTDHQRQSDASKDDVYSNFISNVFVTKLNQRQDNLYIERNHNAKYYKI